LNGLVCGRDYHTQTTPILPSIRVLIAAATQGIEFQVKVDEAYAVTERSLMRGDKQVPNPGVGDQNCSLSKLNERASLAWINVVCAFEVHP